MYTAAVMPSSPCGYKPTMFDVEDISQLFDQCVNDPDNVRVNGPRLQLIQDMEPILDEYISFQLVREGEVQRGQAREHLIQPQDSRGEKIEVSVVIWPVNSTDSQDQVNIIFSDANCENSVRVWTGSPQTLLAGMRRISLGYDSNEPMHKCITTIGSFVGMLTGAAVGCSVLVGGISLTSVAGASGGWGPASHATTQSPYDNNGTTRYITTVPEQTTTATPVCRRVHWVVVAGVLVGMAGGWATFKAISLVSHRIAQRFYPIPTPWAINLDSSYSPTEEQPLLSTQALQRRSQYASSPLPAYTFHRSYSSPPAYIPSSPPPSYPSV